MRSISMEDVNQWPVPPDTVYTFGMTGGSSGQASDWLSSGSTAMGNASSAGIAVVCITMMSTLGVPVAGVASVMNANSSLGLSSGLSSGGSTNAFFGVNGQRFMQVPGGSTGFSVATFAPATVTVEAWRK